MSEFEIVRRRNASAEDQARSAIDQAIGRAAALGNRDEDDLDRLMELGDQLLTVLDDIYGLTGGAK